MNPELETLSNPERVYSKTDVIGTPTTVPMMRGVYAWFFVEELPLVPISDCIKFKDLSLLYVGISPSRPKKNGTTSKENLYSRIRYHYNGNAYGSTLRLSLGCLLSKKLGIQLRRIGKSGKRMTFTKEGESALSSWMEENAFVTWVVHETPWEIEEAALRVLSLPLNLKGNEHHPFHSSLTKLRKTARDQARKLPRASERN